MFQRPTPRLNRILRSVGMAQIMVEPIVRQLTEEVIMADLIRF